MGSKLLTIFTPTFNRKHTLPQLYESLKNLDRDCFEWLIVDDGSIDGTRELVEIWVKENFLDIKYLYQENHGKMAAHNSGVINCNTEYFMCVDSDDFIDSDAVNSIKDVLFTISNNPKLAGLIAYKCDKNRKLVCGQFGQKEYSTLNDLYRSGFFGDTAIIYKTSILKNYLFPEIDREKFITEDYVYAQIDEKYEMFLLPKPLIICEYLNDGYTKSAIKLLIENPKGMSMYYDLKIKFSKSLKEKMMFTIRYIAINKIGKIQRAYKQSNAKLLYILLYPFGIFYAYSKLIKYKKFMKK